MFGGKTKEALFDAKIENATLKIEVEAVKRERDSISANLIFERSERQKFERAANDLDKKNGILLERLDLLANHLPPAPTKAFNSMSEEQEDADYALHAGLIDRDEYEAILASAGALNTEIAFDSDIPRL